MKVFKHFGSGFSFGSVEWKACDDGYTVSKIGRE
jgi:hypothetical protein